MNERENWVVGRDRTYCFDSPIGQEWDEPGGTRFAIWVTEPRDGGLVIKVPVCASITEQGVGAVQPVASLVKHPERLEMLNVATQVWRAAEASVPLDHNPGHVAATAAGPVRVVPHLQSFGQGVLAAAPVVLEAEAGLAEHEVNVILGQPIKATRLATLTDLLLKLQQAPWRGTPPLREAMVTPLAVLGGRTLKETLLDGDMDVLTAHSGRGADNLTTVQFALAGDALARDPRRTPLALTGLLSRESLAEMGGYVTYSEFADAVRRNPHRIAQRLGFSPQGMERLRTRMWKVERAMPRENPGIDLG
jgi:hypothetical protein